MRMIVAYEGVMRIVKNWLQCVRPLSLRLSNLCEINRGPGASHKGGLFKMLRPGIDIAILSAAELRRSKAKHAHRLPIGVGVADGSEICRMPGT